MIFQYTLLYCSSVTKLTKNWDQFRIRKKDEFEQHTSIKSATYLEVELTYMYKLIDIDILS